MFPQDQGQRAILHHLYTTPQDGCLASLWGPDLWFVAQGNKFIQKVHWSPPTPPWCCYYEERCPILVILSQTLATHNYGDRTIHSTCMYHSNCSSQTCFKEQRPSQSPQVNGGYLNRLESLPQAARTVILSDTNFNDFDISQKGR